MLCSIATSMDAEGLASIQKLEKELGSPLLAFSCHKVDPAEITKEQLARVQALEKKLGVTLVAVRTAA